jgi:hypothetical protein
MQHATPAAAASLVETLEPRKLMASVGPVVAQHFVGTQEAVTAVVLTFDVPLEATSAQNVDSYRMVRKFRTSGDDGFGFGGPIFGGGGEGPDNESNRIQIETANFDPVANAVTLTTKRPFELRKSFTVVLVRGRGDNSVMTAAGTPIDGDGNGREGGDVVLRYKARANKVLKFKEADGDIATLRVTGGGHLLYFLPIRGRSSPALFMRFTDPASSVLTGTVKQGKNGDGVVDIAQISAAATAQLPIQSDPAFRIRTITP